tara:strand:- start:37452 stop:39944 length:2493 start_codon:yes stop_codon:yes gene_type:complete
MQNQWGAGGSLSDSREERSFGLGCREGATSEEFLASYRDFYRRAKEALEACECDPTEEKHSLAHSMIRVIDQHRRASLAAGVSEEDLEYQSTLEASLNKIHCHGHHSPEAVAAALVEYNAIYEAAQEAINNYRDDVAGSDYESALRLVKTIDAHRHIALTAGVSESDLRYESTLEVSLQQVHAQKSRSTEEVQAALESYNTLYESAQEAINNYRDDAPGTDYESTFRLVKTIDRHRQVALAAGVPGASLRYESTLEVLLQQVCLAKNQADSLQTQVGAPPPPPPPPPSFSLVVASTNNSRATTLSEQLGHRRSMVEAESVSANDDAMRQARQQAIVREEQAREEQERRRNELQENINRTNERRQAGGMSALFAQIQNRQSNAEEQEKQALFQRRERLLPEIINALDAICRDENESDASTRDRGFRANLAAYFGQTQVEASARVERSAKDVDYDEYATHQSRWVSATDLLAEIVKLELFGDMAYAVGELQKGFPMDAGRNTLMRAIEDNLLSVKRESQEYGAGVRHVQSVFDQCIQNGLSRVAPLFSDMVRSPLLTGVVLEVLYYVTKFEAAKEALKASDETLHTSITENIQQGIMSQSLLWGQQGSLEDSALFNSSSLLGSMFLSGENLAEYRAELLRDKFNELYRKLSNLGETVEQCASSIGSSTRDSNERSLYYYLLGGGVSAQRAQQMAIRKRQDSLASLDALQGLIETVSGLKGEIETFNILPDQQERFNGMSEALIGYQAEQDHLKAHFDLLDLEFRSQYPRYIPNDRNTGGSVQASLSNSTDSTGGAPDLLAMDITRFEQHNDEAENEGEDLLSSIIYGDDDWD